MSKLLKQIAIIGVPAVLAQVVIVALVVMLVRSAREQKPAQPPPQPTETVARQAGTVEYRTAQARTQIEQPPARAPEGKSAHGPPLPAEGSEPAEQGPAHPQEHEEKQEPQQGADQALPAPEPARRLVLRLDNGTAALADGLPDDATRCELPVEGLAGVWHVADLGDWQARAADQASGIRSRATADGVEIVGKSLATGQDARIVAVRPLATGLLFEKAVGVSHDQFKDCLRDIAWIKLCCEPRNEELVLLTRPLGRDVQLKTDVSGTSARAEAAVPSVLAGLLEQRELDHPKSMTDQGGYEAQVEALFAGTALTVCVSYSYLTTTEALRAAEELKKVEEAHQSLAETLRKAQQERKAASRRVDEAHRPVWLREKAWERAKEDHRQKAIALGLFETYFREARKRASIETLEKLLEQRTELIGAVNNAALNAAATRTAWELTTQQQVQPIRLARQEEEAKERLYAIISTEQEARERVKEAADKKSTLEKPERESWDAAFGRFPAHLELKLDGQVIARLELLPPTG